jgi:hypothetical protein
MHVRGDLATAVPHLDHLECTEHGAAVIPVPVRKDDSVHGAHIESKAFDVSFEHRGIGSGVEQERPRDIAAPRSDGTG